MKTYEELIKEFPPKSVNEMKALAEREIEEWQKFLKDLES